MEPEIRGKVPHCPNCESEGPFWRRVSPEKQPEDDPFTGIVDLKCASCNHEFEIEVEHLRTEVAPLPTWEHIRKVREN